MSARITRVVTSGPVGSDADTRATDTNVWVIGDDSECAVIDAAHDTDAILAAVDGRHVLGILLTHAHGSHSGVATDLAGDIGTHVYLHPHDREPWDDVHPGVGPDGYLDDGQVFTVAGAELEVLHTPGHSPGSCCFHSRDLGVVFTGDTLFASGPGSTARPADAATLAASVAERLLTLPAETVVHPGHGPDSTVGTHAAGAGAPADGMR